MTVNDDPQVALAGPEAVTAAPPPISRWEDRSGEELRSIIQRGFAGGDDFAHAVAETERRAREALHRQDEAGAIKKRHEESVRISTLAAIAGACVLIAALLGWWLGG